MTTKEFSDQFDALYNQQYYVLFSMQNPVALDEYEKSLYLTKAQENVVETLYRAGYGIPEGFEKTEYARRILSPLVLNVEGLEFIPENFDSGLEIYTLAVKAQHTKTSENSQLFIIPDQRFQSGEETFLGIYGIIYEQATFGGDDPCASGRVADIVPVAHDDLHRVMRNPFRGPSIRRVLRVDHSGEFITGSSPESSQISEILREQKFYVIELISKYPVAKYFARVLRKTLPIILVSLDDDSPSIEGFKDKMECELNPAVHKTILEEAVKLALASKTLNTIPTVPQPKESKNKDAGE